jgi:NADH-quinone oxidoreductase subunit C
MEKGRAGLGRGFDRAERGLMPGTPAITDIEQLKDHPAVIRLLASSSVVVEGAKFDREEMSIYVHRGSIRDACVQLRDDPGCPFNYLSDVTCVDWYPQEPRFEVIYHLLSISQRERVRLKVRLSGSSPSLESITSIWPSANYFEREVYDLFGVRFEGHPYLRRILMPESWDGYPLRKDYPVEGYR